MQFKVRTFNAASGAIEERILDSPDAAHVTAQVASESVTILSLETHQKENRVRRKGGFNVTLFCEELRTLLSSGMSLTEAIETLCSKNNEHNTDSILLELQQKLLEGKPLSAALQLSQYSFPPLLVASIKAAEQTSLIDQALDEYVTYEKVGQELGKKIISAAIYPSLVISFGFLVCIFMIAYVVPRFSKVYEDFTQSLSFSTKALMKLGEFAGNNIIVLTSLFVCIVGGLVITYRNGQLKLYVLRLLSYFKITKHYLRLYQLARIYQTISMLLKGGYSLADAIPLSSNLAFDEQLKQQLLQVHIRVTEGTRLSKAFAENKLTDSVTERLLQVGERSGTLPKVLDIISLNYRQEFTRFIEHATKLAEPLLLMVVGVMIGAIIILMYMPVFDLAGGIQ